jgi:hypothetical protein
MLDHSQAPALIKTPERSKKAWGESANKAGNKTANMANAVMMRCFNICPSETWPSNGHDLLLFARYQLVNFSNVFVCDLLHLSL